MRKFALDVRLTVGDPPHEFVGWEAGIDQAGQPALNLSGTATDVGAALDQITAIVCKLDAAQHHEDQVQDALRAALGIGITRVTDAESLRDLFPDLASAQEDE